MRKLFLVGCFAALAWAQDVFPPASPSTTTTNLAASRSFVKEVNGDLWITANAYYDGSNWQRVDTTKVAFGYQLQGTNNIPGGEVTPGATLWVARPGANPINATFGAVGGWEIGILITGDKQMVVGGGGIEIDGNGSFPYARFIHNTINSTLYTGLITNLFPDFSGVDSNTTPSWFAGVVGDAFKVQRAVAGSTSLSDLLTVNTTGDLTVPRVATSVNTVTFSTTPTFNLSLGDFQRITLTGNVTSSTTSNVKAGQRVVLQICQDATGSRTFVYPTTMKGGQTIGTTASKCSTQEFASFDGVNLYAVAAGTTNQ